MDRYNSGAALPLYQAKAPPKPLPSLSSLTQNSSFAITRNEVIASCIFWIFMCCFIVEGISYGILYHSINDSDLEGAGCCQNFGGTMQDNLNFIETYEKGDAGPYLMRLGPESFSSNFKGTQAPKELVEIPPIVTAVSTKDFYHVQSLIRQWKEEIKPMFPNAKFVIYDIGLYAKELELIKEHCGCDIRSFQSSAYPSHVADITTFAYRPIIIQTMIEEHGSVLWMDPKAIITKAQDLKQLKYRRDHHFFLWSSKEFVGTVAFTNQKTFEYLKESRCCYLESSLIDTSAMVFYRTNITWSNVVKPWLKCALNKDCIAPAKSTYSGCFELRSPKTTGCHRYDQSVLSIIMERMFMFTIKQEEKYIAPRVSRLQDEYLEYFPEQPWTYTEIFFVTLMPVVCLGAIVFMYRRRHRNGSPHKSSYSKR